MIGERLFKMRKERKMKQEELAEILSLSKYSISLYENNKSVPSMETLCKIAETFDVSVDYLKEQWIYAGHCFTGENIDRIGERDLPGAMKRKIIKEIIRRR